MRFTRLTPFSLIASSGLFFFTVILCSCGNQAEDVNWLKEDGSYCTPSASSRTDDCFIGPSAPGEDLVITETQDLDQICSSRCTKIRNLRVNSFEGLRDLRAFEGLTVQNSALVSVNPDLETTEGLRMADGTRARIETNPRLEEIVGFEAVQTSQGFELYGSPKIEDLDTFDSLEEIEGNTFRVQGTSISDMSVLDGVKFTDRAHFFLRLNDSLRSVPEIEGEGLSIQIEENHSLTDVSGLEGLTNVGGLIVFSNKNLKTCHVKNVADQIDFHEMAEVQIRRNASGSCSN